MNAEERSTFQFAELKTLTAEDGLVIFGNLWIPAGNAPAPVPPINSFRYTDEMTIPEQTRRSFYLTPVHRLPCHRLWRNNMLSFVSIRLPATVIFVLTATLLGGCQRSANTMTPCISLRVIYHDKETQSAETVFNGEQGASVEVHSGTATYVFKNNLPVPMKLMFPPIGYAGGGLVPRTPHVNDVKTMPSFCRKQQIVTLPPLGEQSFESPYLFTGGKDIVEHFVFGCPTEGAENGMFVGEVDSIPEVHPKQ
jgi:hypothetical protein